MRDESGKPVFVPGKQDPKFVLDSNGNPIVPSGVGVPGSTFPKDTLPRPTPKFQMPTNETSVQETETTNQRAVENTTTYDELVSKKGFKSVEDLAIAYKNLESQNKRVEVSLADAMKARQIEPESEEELSSIGEAETSEDALRIVQNLINKRVAQVEDKWEYKEYLQENPNDRQFAAEAIEIVKDNPGIKWSIAFKAARAETGVRPPEVASIDDTKVRAQTIPSSQRGQESSIQDIIQGIKTGQIPLSEAKKFINSLQLNR